ncbi:MAG: DegV family protein [Lachnospiraceae bacterium]|nr:DegV family protein [Lachnospiraceae bacterium]MBP3507870.1 DegV family protein [Lachnospiraceae bacterium]
MKPYIISTDCMADLPADFIKEHNISLHPLYYVMGDVTYNALDGALPEPEFYNRMRNGEMPTTMASNPEFIEQSFTKNIEDGYDIFHISFSSGLSSSYNNTAVTAKEMLEKYPDSKIIVIDSLCASLGQGLLVYYACKKKEEGATIDELAEYITDLIPHICHQFTVDDLFHLHRGGRVSKATAILGTIANIKPVLHVDNEGKLINISKIRGRKRSLTALVDNMEKTMGDYKNPIVFISHGDCIEDAEFVKNLVEERFGIHDFIINYVGSTIGAHSGPGTVALFYLGETR